MTEYDAIFGRAADGQASALSAEGLERRAAMRDSLMGAVVSRRRRRTATRWGSALAAAVVLVSLAWPRAVVLPDPGLEIADAEVPAAFRDVKLERTRPRSRRMPSSPVATIVFASVLAVILGWALLDEALRLQIWGALALVLAGIWLVNRR